jgi:hypothetical protein
LQDDEERAMFASNPQAHEEQAISRVRDRLQARFSERNPAEVTGVVETVARRFTTARIRDYIPVLVERISRDELNHRFAAR